MEGNYPLVYDYTLLSSFLFASLLILIIGYTRYLMQRLAQKNKESDKKAEIQYNSKRVDINCRLIIFIVFIIVISRIAFTATFPIEVNQLQRTDSIFSMRTFFLIWQTILVFSYIYFLFRMFLGNRIIDEFRYIYLAKTLAFYAVVAIIDLVSSFIFYNILIYDLIFPINDVIPVSNSLIPQGNQYINILLIFIGLIGFILFFIRLQKKRTPFNFIGYILIHVVLLSFVLFFMFSNIDYFFAEKSLVYSALDIFSFSTGFAGWIWLSVLYLGLSSQSFGFTIIRWKDKFINKQIAINYIVQLVKLSFVSVICICFIAILPVIFKLTVNILN